MKSYELKNIEAYRLAEELSWLATERLPLWVKYRITSLAESVSKKLKTYIDIRNEEITKIDESGNIPKFIESEDRTQLIRNPKHIAFEKAMAEVDEEVITVKSKPIPLSALPKEDKSDKPYGVIFRFFYDDLPDEPATESDEDEGIDEGEIVASENGQELH